MCKLLKVTKCDPETLCQFGLFLFLFFFIFLSFGLFRAALSAYGGSQARSQIGAVAAGLHHNHSHNNAVSEPCLQPRPQLTAMPDP